jgi:serine/threonine-protein kinase
VKLGGSLQRRRGAGGGSPARGRDPVAKEHSLSYQPWMLAGRTAALGAVGLLIGYLVATRVLFPPPPPPGDLVSVPELQGLTVERAHEKLTDAGLRLGDVEALRHPSLDSGVVVGQGPLGGQLVKPGSDVRVTVSLGALRQGVPDVSRLALDRAVRVLETIGFRVAVDSTDSDLPLGAVVAVDPPVGTVLPVPSEIELSVSRGPARVPMPYLLGLTQEAATDSLAAVGLSVQAVDTVFRFGRDQGLVVDQLPPPDSLIARGSGVHLSVGRKGG